MLESLTSVDLININRGLGESGKPKDPSQGVDSALASWRYYDTLEEQVLSIAISISHGHLFQNGNKRTALTLIREIAEIAGITMVSDDKQFDAILLMATKGGKPSTYLRLFFK